MKEVIVEIKESSRRIIVTVDGRVMHTEPLNNIKSIDKRVKELTRRFE